MSPGDSAPVDGPEERLSRASASRGGTAALLVLVGTSLLATGIFGLWRDHEWIAQPFYAWVWWGYILTLDGFVAWRRGDSLLTKRRGFVIPICLWSVSFWFLFELVNARIRNWYYVGVYPADEFAAGAVFTLLAFATVFLGIFETHDALTASGLWKGWRGRRRRFPVSLTFVLQGVGLATLAVALLFPRYLAPLVWGSFTLLVDPWNYRRGTRSLLRDFEHGDYGLLARLLTAGLVCGVIWESANFFAPQKWIYTVRGLEGFKVFEMPLLGFLGFPALALDSMAAFALMASLLLGNRTWERPEDLAYRLDLRRPARRSIRAASVVAQVGFWLLVSYFATPVNIGSFKLELADLGLRAEEVRRLEEAGIERPRQLRRALRDRPDRVRERLGWTAERARVIGDRVELFTFKGSGSRYGELLERVGVRRPSDLAGGDPLRLHREIGQQARALGVRPPRLDFVKVWVGAAEGR